MKDNPKEINLAKEFYFDFFNYMHSHDTSFSWVKNLISLVTYPSEETLLKYIEEWMIKYQIPFNTIPKIALT